VPRGWLKKSRRRRRERERERRTPTSWASAAYAAGKEGGRKGGGTWAAFVASSRA